MLATFRDGNFIVDGELVPINMLLLVDRHVQEAEDA